MRPLAIPFHQHGWGLPCKDGSVIGEPQSPCVLGVHRRVYLHAATLSAFAYSPPTHNQHDWELSLASALPGGLLSRNQTFSVQVLLAANSHACWPQLLLGTESSLLRFRFDTQATCDGVWGLLPALFLGQKEVREPNPERCKRNEHYSDDYLLKQCFFSHHGDSS